jgi:hypothetical protein
MRATVILSGASATSLIGAIGIAAFSACSVDGLPSAAESASGVSPVQEVITRGELSAAALGEQPGPQAQSHRNNDQPISAAALQRLIDKQVGGIDKLKVPATFATLPQPRLADGTIDPRFMITEAKRYLGKMLFVDPIRNQRIRPQFGGIATTRQTMSCGSCHNGLFASKAGQIANLGVCGEGISFTDELGFLHARRRRDQSTPGCAGPDVAPTLTANFVGTPQEINGNGDAIDSVARLSPNVIAAGFSTRLLAGGKAGDTGPGGFHRNDNPPLEDLTFALEDAHRMLECERPPGNVEI